MENGKLVKPKHVCNKNDDENGQWKKKTIETTNVNHENKNYAALQRLVHTNQRCKDGILLL